MNNNALVVTRKDNVLNIRFNRPASLNAINSELAEAFLKEITNGLNDDNVSIIVISGCGRSFMAGGDITQFNEAPESITESLIAPMNKALELIRETDKLVITAVHGPVAGAGMSIALAGDLTLAAEDTRFTFAYTQLGASGDLGITWNLPRLIGTKRALGVALLAQSIASSEALQLGLINKIIPVASFEEDIAAITGRLSKLSSHAISEIKRLMHKAPEQAFSSQIQEEKAAFGRCIQTQAFRDAIQSFLSR